MPMAAPTMVTAVKMTAAVNCCTGLKLGGDSKENLLRAICGEGVVFIASASMSTTPWRLARAGFATFFVEVTMAFLVLAGDFVGGLVAVAFAEAFLATAAFLETAVFGNVTFSVGFFFPAGFVAGFFGASGFAGSLFALGFLSFAVCFFKGGAIFSWNAFSWQ
jgi:hypothetical protein